MRHKLLAEDSGNIEQGKTNFAAHLKRILTPPIDEDRDPLTEIIVGKAYSLEELSKIFNWPLEDGFAMFIHDLRTPRRPSLRTPHSPSPSSFLSKNQLSLEKNPDGFWVFKRSI
jgi:hypothetical protein